LTPDEADRLFLPYSDADRLLLAVSGGPDSVCLLRLAADWRGRAGNPVQLFAATVDHGLRPEAGLEAVAVGEWAGLLGVPHTVLPWRGPKPRAGIQNAARDARYALLAAHAEAIGAGVLMTAHHADDQAETVLMRLLRGSGIHGLSGMAQVRRRAPGLLHARPLLTIPKERLLATLAAQGQPFFEDPSNADPKFFRSRMRGIGPALAQEGLDRDRLLTLADRARRADEALDAVAAKAVRDCAVPAQPPVVRLSSALFRHPEEIVIRALIQVLERTGPLQGPLRLERVEMLAASLIEAAAANVTLRRSIAGRVVNLDRHAGVTISCETIRRRGRGRTDS
jgi:tRNA(Ile)-lysidine synthase